MSSVMMVGAVLGVAVGACSAPPEPHALNTEVVWSDGVPNGDLESDARVRAVREFELLTAASSNALNFSDPRLSPLISDTVLDSMFRSAARAAAREEMVLVAGPAVLSPLAVEDDAVLACVSGPASWEVRGGQATPRDVIEPLLVRYQLGEIQGQWSVRSVSRTEPCDLPSVSVARFDPEPTPDDIQHLTPQIVVGPGGERGDSVSRT